MDGLENAVTEILARHDLAGLDGDRREYEGEARELVGLMRGARAPIRDDAQVAALLSAVLLRWFTFEDGMVAITWDATACRNAAADIWDAWR